MTNPDRLCKESHWKKVYIHTILNRQAPISEIMAGVVEYPIPLRE